MGGTPTTAKYTIYGGIEIDGVVDKPDVIGAIFGQTEGLLGEELDLRELQKSGRIGRIQVDLESKSGKSFGEMIIPSSLDRVETAIVAAAIETIDKVGPCTARVFVKKIEDVREEKRRKVIDRARDILVHWETEGAFEIKELSEEIMKSVRVHEIGKFGPDNLPAGPDVDKSDMVIVTEGRADVVNMLRHGYKNVIGMEGASVPETIKDLSKKKSIIAFVDGDRGGELILRELLQVADVDYIARAPVGKEVEDLTGKELAKYLRSKIPVEQYQLAISERKPEAPQKQGRQDLAEVVAERMPEKVQESVAERAAEKVERAEKELARVALAGVDVEKIKAMMEQLQGSLEANLLDESWESKQKVAVRELAEILQNTGDKIHAVVFDGVITQRLLDISNNRGVAFLIGARIGNIAKRPQGITILTFEDITSR
ncbi:MAG: DNA primase [Candidatus Verstraetearchaeota archaeon]|nr:DNA primase [Candidatus Verstraetearchaeota archaeon]